MSTIPPDRMPSTSEGRPDFPPAIDEVFLNTRIAVIIPTYNRAELLMETLRSVARQERPADEIIVVDDGSTDDTEARVTAFKRETGVPIRYMLQKNAGQAAARNTGMRASDAGLLLFLDSDDLLLPHALRDLEAKLRGHPNACLAYGLSQTINEIGALLEEVWACKDAEGDVWARIVRGNFIRTPGLALIRRQSLSAVGIWNEAPSLRGSEDWEMWLRLSDIAPIVRLPKPVLQYRVHSTNDSGNARKMHHASLILLKMEQARHKADGNRAKTAQTAEAYRLARHHTAVLYRAEIAAARERGDQVHAKELIRLNWQWNPLQAAAGVVKAVVKVLLSPVPIIRRALASVALRFYHRLPLVLRRRIRRGMGITDP